MGRKKSMYVIILLLVFLLGFGNILLAEEYPVKPIEILMPYGVNDRTTIIFRVIADNMSKLLKQPVILTPAVGGGGTLAGEKIAHRTKPDGYTLLQVNSATCGVALFTKKDVTYTVNDFTYLVQTHASEVALVAASNAPFKNLEEYIAFAQKNPHSIKHASTGIGTGGHLSFEYLKLRCGALKIDLVPFRTPPEVAKAVLSGTVHSASIYGGGGGPNDDLNKIVDGGARILAVTSEKRLRAWPEVPTFKEKGIDLVWSGWWGIGGPKGLPKNVISVLNNVLYRAMEDPNVAKTAESTGLRFEFRKHEEFTEFVKEYNKLIEMIVKEAKIPRQ